MPNIPIIKLVVVDKPKKYILAAHIAIYAAMTINMVRYPSLCSFTIYSINRLNKEIIQ